MKNHLVFICLLFCIYGYSQENKNKMVVKGGITYTNDNSTHTSRISAFPYYEKTAHTHSYGNASIGYFVSNNLSLGVLSSFSTFKDQMKSDYITQRHQAYKQKSNSVAVFARYNHTVGDHKLGWFVHIDGGYSWTESDFHIMLIDYQNNIIEFSDHSKSGLIDFHLNPGIIYFINRWVSVETTLGSIHYYIGHIKNNNTNPKISGFSTNFFMTSLDLGFSFYFGRKNSEGKKITE